MFHLLKQVAREVTQILNIVTSLQKGQTQMAADLTALTAQVTANTQVEASEIGRAHV